MLFSGGLESYKIITHTRGKYRKNKDLIMGSDGSFKYELLTDLIAGEIKVLCLFIVYNGHTNSMTEDFLDQTW